MLDNVTKGEAFLSTPSARRATARQRAGGILLVISIHALREEGDGDAAVGVAAHRGISIHALREEGDTIISYTSDSIKISIHALREEGDPHHRQVRHVPQVFLSTPSARRATVREDEIGAIIVFLSTPSARRATTGRRCSR